jgi:hypothetical protein
MALRIHAGNKGLSRLDGDEGCVVASVTVTKHIEGIWKAMLLSTKQRYSVTEVTKSDTNSTVLALQRERPSKTPGENQWGFPAVMNR